MNRTCLFCSHDEALFLELVVWDSKSGERARDVVGGVCGECAIKFERASVQSFIRHGDEVTLTYRVHPDSIAGAMVERYQRLIALFAKQFDAGVDRVGYRLLPFTHPTSLQLWKVRKDEEDRVTARINPMPMPEVIRATPEEHEELVREAVKEAERK